MKMWLYADEEDDTSEESEEIDEGPRKQNETHDLKNDTFYSGYQPVDIEGQDIFYILFESRRNETRDEDPLVIWLRGEPGCSTTATLFENNSPYIFGVNETTGSPMLVNNPNSWNNFTNVLYLDQPIGAGYSFYKDVNTPRIYSLDQAVDDFIHFMKMFYDMHDQFRGRDTYIIGQDFVAGKYIPAFVQAMKDVKKNEFEDEDFEAMFLANSTKEWAEWFNLKGIALNSPMMDDVVQRNQTKHYAEHKGLVSSAQTYFMTYPFEWCKTAIELGSVLQEIVYCAIEESFATGNPLYPLFNIRNIEQECTSWFDCYQNNDLTNMALNQADIIELFGANLTMEGSLLYSAWAWADCNSYSGYLQQS